ncbi:hypothetical protein niasHT_025112 [Heterodera trifolii]|uniref:Transmembrane protein n=1 Tax=Heterodera trifolii TaxID=157864 RepID=A0ABD2K207_9BILA
MVHPMCATAANRLATINNFGILNRWHCAPLNRIKGGTALTQFRTAVGSGGGERRHSAQFDDGKETKRTGEGDKYRHQSSSFSSSSAHFGRFSSSTDPKQILHEFIREHNRVLKEYDLSGDKNQNNFNQRYEKFFHDFNKQISPEFKVSLTFDGLVYALLSVFLGGIGLIILGVFIAFRLLTRNAILPEHRAVVAQQHLAVTSNEFVQHFLAAGQVRMIYFYPRKSVAVAVLRPGAVIRGHPYHLSVVPIRLDPCIASGTNFLQGLEEAQNRLGIDPSEHVPVTIHSHSILSAFMLILGWFILLGLFFICAKVARCQPLHKVTRKDCGSKEGKMNK